MAVVYYIGCNEVETKKGDRVICWLLCHGEYGKPAIREFWLDASTEIAQTVLELVPGCAVLCATVFGNERSLAQIAENPDPDIPMLDLTAFHDSGVH